MKPVCAATAWAGLIASTSAQYWHPAVVTAEADLPSNGFTPKPTDPPALHDLRKRASSSSGEEEPTVYLAPDATCGYLSGRVGAAYTCYTGYQCVFVTASIEQGHVACCNDLACNLRKSCVDYKTLVSSSSLCDQGCQEDIYTLKCSNSAAPFCNTISFSSDIIDYWCYISEYSTAQRAYLTFVGETDDRSLSPFVFTSTSSFDFSGTASNDNAQPTISNARAATSTSARTSSPATTGDSNDNGSNSGSNDNGSNSGSSQKSTPVGAIVGGVVGGVVAIGLIAVLAFFLLRKKGHPNDSSNNNFQQPQQQQQQQQQPMQQGPPQGGYQPPPPGSQYSSPPTQYSAPLQQGGYYAQDHSSQGGSMYDPRTSQFGTSPIPSNMTGTATSSPPQHFSGIQQNAIHEAPLVNPHSGEAHELG